MPSGYKRTISEMKTPSPSPSAATSILLVSTLPVFSLPGSISAYMSLAFVLLEPLDSSDDRLYSSTQ
ncbi:hypothetical protein BDV37DRAFT_290026 [Aspergillus pseudonomiae]|uniref:Uncharacterized protein n=1 Tax=Aspergillus pseudonomiae TaxID=1506151 RepID=A0A5N7CRD0_9EURO|nr:uncharacterized protein BDV37DRAFT_290026 [Aspergillus pseudonomiae]KAE8396756.1 hypothetical protein BDV37DRAFT_290026 [Aspergillus pseudonomiae]